MYAKTSESETLNPDFSKHEEKNSIECGPFVLIKFWDCFSYIFVQDFSFAQNEENSES